MADWFKFRNDGLDSKGMQFAMSEQPLVTSVWLVLLSEASKNRAAKFKWQDEDFELIGFARKINVSVPVFNQSIALLERIKYLTRRGGFIEIHGWDNLQSDYAKGLDKGYYKKTSKKLASKSLDSTARGEERRVEVERESNLPEVPPMKRKDFDVMVKMRGVPTECADWFWNTHDARNWVDTHGNPIAKVEPLLMNALVKWRQNGHAKNGARQQPQNHKGGNL